MSTLRISTPGIAHIDHPIHGKEAHTDVCFGASVCQIRKPLARLASRLQKQA
jgi:hypothetical protein